MLAAASRHKLKYVCKLLCVEVHIYQAGLHCLQNNLGKRILSDVRNLTCTLSTSNMAA